MEHILGDGLKKLLLAGIGAAATTTEKSKDILDELVAKGELTVEQGKVLNEELKHNIKDKLGSSSAVTEEVKEDKSVSDLLASMTPEQIAELKEKLSQMDNQ